MNELDFISALRGPSGKEKTAGLLDTLKNKAPQIGAGLAGAGVLTGAQYLMNKKNGNQASSAQKAGLALLTSSEAVKDQAERDNRPLTFREDITSATAPSIKNLGDVLARHPVKGALLVAPAGALAGLRILKALK